MRVAMRKGNRVGCGEIRVAAIMTKPTAFFCPPPGIVFCSRRLLQLHMQDP